MVVTVLDRLIIQRTRSGAGPERNTDYAYVSTAQVDADQSFSPWVSLMTYDMRHNRVCGQMNLSNSEVVGLVQWTREASGTPADVIFGDPGEPELLIRWTDAGCMILKKEEDEEMHVSRLYVPIFMDFLNNCYSKIYEIAYRCNNGRLHRREIFFQFDFSFPDHD